MDEPTPRLVLADTLWDFANQGKYGSRAEFDEAVRCYHVEVQEYAPDIQPEECWRPSVVVVQSPCVMIRYFSDSTGDEVWHEIELVSDDATGFTGGELLFKLHNAAVGELRHNAHHWFEGLELSGVSDEGIPVYRLRLGS